jgi:hypothetical protein
VRSRLSLLIATLGLVLVTGCTTTSEGTPLPGPTTTNASPDEPTSDDLPSDGAPKVDNPLDAAHFEQNPCDALTPEDAQTLNVPSTGEQTGDSLGKGCQWINKQTSGSLSIDFFSGDKRGLSSLYQEAKRNNFPYFAQIDDIEGHPAVAFHPEVAKPTADCVVAVGVTDQLVFDTRVAVSDANIGKKNPCDLAAQTASMMLKTMREAA